MAITDGLLPEYDHEMATTRRLLARVPEAELGWKPHDRSMGLGQLAAHLAQIPGWCPLVLGQAGFDIEDAAPERMSAAAAGPVADILAHFDAAVASGRTALAGASDPEMLAPWTLRRGAHEIFTLPRVSTVRTLVLNHLIHHRGQLSVYLRLKDVPLPSIYGPTADEA